MPSLTLRLLQNPAGERLLVKLPVPGKLGQAAQIVLLRHPVHLGIVRVLREDLPGDVGGIQ